MTGEDGKTERGLRLAVDPDQETLQQKPTEDCQQPPQQREDLQQPGVKQAAPGELHA